MEKQQLDRLLRIAKKTNSPVIVLDEKSQELVVLPLSTYEELIDSYMGEDFNEFDEFDPEDDFEDYADDLEADPLPEELFMPERSVSNEGIDQIDREQKVSLDEGSAQGGRKIEPAMSQDFSEEQFYLEPIE